MADTSKIVIARITASIARWQSIVRQFVIWAFADEPVEPELSKPVEPRRLTMGDQWSYLSDIVMGAAARVEGAARCHAAATQQVDLAQYALSSLVDELAAVMDMGGRVRRRATVHVFGAPQASPLLAIGDAIAA